MSISLDHSIAGSRPSRRPKPGPLDFMADLDAPDWMDESLCSQTANPEAFFPNESDTASMAKKVCGLCDVRGQCLAWALGRPENYGIWGGLTEGERRKLRKNPGAPPRPCARPACEESIPATATRHRRYHDTACANRAVQDRDVARLDHQAITAEYLTSGSSMAKVAARHHVQAGVIARILDEHDIPRKSTRAREAS